MEEVQFPKNPIYEIHVTKWDGSEFYVWDRARGKVMRNAHYSDDWFWPGVLDKYAWRLDELGQLAIIYDDVHSVPRFGSAWQIIGYGRGRKQRIKVELVKNERGLAKDEEIRKMKELEEKEMHKRVARRCAEGMI